MNKDLLSYLFGDSQVESEIDETRSTIERIMEEAEEQEPLKIKRTPLVTALKALGLTDVEKELELDPEGFSIKCGEEDEYRRYVKILMDPDSMEKLAELGWVVTRLGDVAMSNEPAEFRIRFLEIHFVNDGETGEVEYGGFPAPNNKLMTDIIKKGRELMATPMDHDADKLNPVEFDDKSSDDNQKGVGKTAHGANPEGKPKTGKSKDESLDLVDQLLVSEGGHKAGCECGFCKNKGSFGKKKKDDAGNKEPEESGSEESSDTSDSSAKGGVSLPGGNMGEAYDDPVDYVDKSGKSQRAKWIRRGKAMPKPAMAEDEPPRYDDVAARLEAKPEVHNVLTCPKCQTKVKVPNDPNKGFKCHNCGYRGREDKSPERKRK